MISFSPLRAAVIGGIVLGVILPFGPILLWSFGRQWWFPALLPEVWSLQSWVSVRSSNMQILEAFRNTVIIALAVTMLALAIGLPAARAIGLYRFRGHRLIELVLLAPTIIPGLALVMGLHVLFIRLGLADTLAGVVLVHLIPALPYFIIVMAGVFANYDQDYEHQARVLGARPWQVLRHVTLPMVHPGIIVGGLFVFLISWNQYILTLLIGGGVVPTLPIILFAFMSAGNYTMGSVVCLIYFAPAVLIMMLTAQHLTGRSSALGQWRPL